MGKRRARLLQERAVDVLERVLPNGGHKVSLPVKRFASAYCPVLGIVQTSRLKQGTSVRISRQYSEAMDSPAEQTAPPEDEAMQGPEVGTPSPLLVPACSVCCARTMLAALQ